MPWAGLFGPFGARIKRVISGTQGEALGWFVWPLRGKDQNGLRFTFDRGVLRPLRERSNARRDESHAATKLGGARRPTVSRMSRATSLA